MKKILYVIDDVNYKSGAQKVTFFQIKELQKYYDVYLLSLTEPKEPIDFIETSHILNADLWEMTEIYAESLKKVLKSEKYSFHKKLLRVLYAVSLRCGMGDVYFERLIKNQLLSVMESFDAVIVVSEASKLRRFVSQLHHPKKIQWVHTDYARWSEFSEWSKAVTKHDKSLYPKFDTIVVLSEYCKNGMLKKIPSIAEKIVVIPNLIDGERIQTLANEKCEITLDEDCLNLVTVARIDREKRIDELLRVAKNMQQSDIDFRWYVIGDGPQRKELEQKNKELNLEEQVKFLGHMENPYPIMSRCDTLVLLSKYEGTPVTIDEAMVLGIGIVAPKIGGIPEQVKEYGNCCLISKGELDIFKFKCKENHMRKLDYVQKNIRIERDIKVVITK